MGRISSGEVLARNVSALVILSGFLLSAPARAVDATGVYLGAGIGESHVNQNYLDDDSAFRMPEKDRLGWKLFGGFRPWSYFGTQLEYLDLGAADLGPDLYPFNGVQNGLYKSRSFARAAGLFGIGYLPIPPQWLDVYGKVGIARLWTRYRYSENAANVYENGSSTPLGQVSVSQSQDKTTFAYGLGVQARLGAFAVQLEYERLNAPATQFDSYGQPSANPGLLTLGLSWKFP